MFFKKHLTLLKLLASLATLVALGAWLYGERGDLWEIWLKVNYWHLGIAFLLLPLNVGIQAWIWQVLLKGVYPDEKFSDSLGAVLCGASLGFFTPARIGDFAGRALYLPHRNKMELLALAALQQMLAFLCYIGFGTLALLYFMPKQLGFSEKGWFFIGFLGLFLLLFALYPLLHPKKVYGFIHKKLPTRFQSTFRFLNYLTQKQLLKLWGLTILRYLIFCFQFVILLFAFPFELSIFDATIATMLMYYAKTFVPSFAFAELGIREATAVFFIGLMGGNESVAFYAATLIFLINLVIPALCGIPFVLKIQNSKLDTFRNPKSPSKSEASP